MWKKFVKDYLSFTKKDRVAVMVLLSLIFLVVLLPYGWPVQKPRPLSQQEVEKIKQQVAGLTTKKATPATGPAEENAGINRGYYPVKETGSKEKGAVFYFDPNTLDKAGWLKLGLREKTVATILHYLSRGGRFKQPEDLGKIYGLFKDDYERLLPYVKIAGKPIAEKQYKEEKKEYTNSTAPAYTTKKLPPPAPIEINNADTTALIALPGIGSKLAARIIAFRDKLGGFYAVQQIAETYGLPDSTFAKIKNSLQCMSAAVQQLNINTVDANTLKQHPYIRWNLANAIVQYRTQHGSFKSVDELQQIAIITPELFEKVKPYLRVK